MPTNAAPVGRAMGGLSAGAVTGIAAIAIASLGLSGCQKDTPAPIEPDGAEATAVEDGASDTDGEQPEGEPSTVAVPQPPTEEPVAEAAPTAQDEPGSAQPPAPKPSATTIAKPPNFDRPMVARYGVAPRPTPPDWK